MKYLWLIFFLCAGGLALQIKLSPPVTDLYADGKLACAPVPPERLRSEPRLLAPPVLLKIPPLTQPVQVQASSIEIFATHSDSGLAETRQADNLDWGIAKSLPADSPVQLAYAPEPRLVEPVPVNVPPTVNDAAGVQLDSLFTSSSVAWAPELERWSTESLILAMLHGVRGYEPGPGQVPGPDGVDTMNLPEIASLPSLTSGTAQAEIASVEPVEQNSSSTSALGSGMTFYLPSEKVETASIEPKQLVSKQSEPPASGPNLYLPAGALDEEGAMLTLIRPELKVYELPDESAAATGQMLKSGDKVRPLTRLRNADGFDWIKFEHHGKSVWAQAEYFIRVDPRNRRQYPEGNLPVGKESVDRDSALPVDYQPNDLVQVKQSYVFGAKHVLLRKEAAEAFERMAADAARKGLHIRAFSGFRDFAYQKNLYLQAVEKNGPKQDGTAAPGYSEHQLGTTADICGENQRTILSGKFGDTPEGRWLDENSEKYGFRKSYTTENSDEVGYKPEPWHFRFVGIAQNSGSKDIANR